MTARVPSWVFETSTAKAAHVPEVRVEDAVQATRLAIPGKVTGKMVDEAVKTVLQKQGWLVPTAEALKYNMSRDHSGDVSQAFYASKIAQERTHTRGVARRDLVIKYVLTDDEVSALTEYAPEFKLHFQNRESHDHGMPAASRIVDRLLVQSRAPYGMPTSDIGGNPMVYIRESDDTTHVCGGLLDEKDPMRHKLRMLEAREIARSSDKQVSRVLARQYLNGGGDGFVCGKRAQDCSHQSSVLLSIHVYDILMQDWPEIMEKKNAVVVEGCIIFSNEFWKQRQGELAVSGARYEIDVAANKFRMGFRGSPSWWYEHDWSKFMLYGVDQELYSATATYAYKVIERRGDTLFFRILRTEGSPGFFSRNTSYRTPGVPVVRVNGFELTEDRAWLSPTMRRKVYDFPANLWNEMLSQASEDFERGVMDYLKMYNHYRTISVRQTVNAVLIMGGEQVDQQELVPLVVHVCLAAAAQSLLGQRETRYLTQVEMQGRLRATQSTARKFANALAAVGKAALMAPLVVFKSLSRILNSITADRLEQWVLDWEPAWEIITVPAHLLMVKTSIETRKDHATETLRDHAAATRVIDPVAAALADDKLRSVFTQLCPHVQLPGTPVKTQFEPETRPDVGVPIDKVDASSTVQSSSLPDYVTEVGADLHEARLEAIREHLTEIDMDNRAKGARLAAAYRKLCVANHPDVSGLQKRADIDGNPDLWLVERGVIVRSALGVPKENFKYSAVYTPDADSLGEHVRAVHKREWEGWECGSYVKRDHHVLNDDTYSGWVLANDEIVVFNGAEIIQSLKQALTLEHRYVINLQAAPPGSGKTYSIVHSVASDGSECVMCPVRESILDTRAQIEQLYPQFPDPKLRLRTLHSYLVGLTYADKTRDLQVKKLKVDECYMAHSALIYAAAALLGCKTVEVYGDDKQIPHIPRVQAPKLHLRVDAQTVEHNWITRRCPAEAVAAWGHVYDWKVRTVSEVSAPFVEVRSTQGREIPNGCVMMCMYQADKVTLKKLYAGVRGIKIITAHEGEGKTYDHVWLHRFDARKRLDKRGLFDQQPHVLVAMSRHRRSFVYVRPADLGDLVSQWIAKSREVRRVAAAKDIGSAGVSKEFA